MLNAKEQIGINAHRPDHAQLNMLLQLGVKWIRIDGNWPSVQPTKDVWDFKELDTIVRFCDEVGIKIFMSLAYTPKWSAPNDSFYDVPDRMIDWTRFVDMITERYSGRSIHWGLWNEPNTEYWNGTTKEYIAMLFPAYIKIRANDPGGKIVCGDINVGQNHNWIAWVKELSNFTNLFDVFSFHLYPKDSNEFFQQWYRGNWPKWVKPFRALLDYWYPNRQARCKVLTEAFWGKELWLTEIGWQTTGKFGLHDTDLALKQAQNYSHIIKNKPVNIDKIFFYDLQDDPRPEANTSFGILTNSYGRKDSYGVLQRFYKNT